MSDNGAPNYSSTEQCKLTQVSVDGHTFFRGNLSNGKRVRVVRTNTWSGVDGAGRPSGDQLWSLTFED